MSAACRPTHSDGVDAAASVQQNSATRFAARDFASSDPRRCRLDAEVMDRRRWLYWHAVGPSTRRRFAVNGDDGLPPHITEDAEILTFVY